MKVLVLTISDRASKGEYKDKSGPAIEELLSNQLNKTEISRQVISDDPMAIRQAFQENLDKDIILTTGGTGLGPRDHTPEMTESFCDRMIPGIAEMIRRESFKETANAVLSRGIAGVKGKTVIINFPGSEKGARFCAELVIPILTHAKDMLSGKKH